MPARISRRQLLHRAAGAGGVVLLGGAAAGRAYKANARLNVGLVGVGGRGSWFVQTIPRMENVVAFCDVNDRKMAGAFRQCAELARRFAASPHAWEKQAAPAFARLAEKKVRTFRDFRRMLDALGDGLDAVVVATTDHSHAVISAAAIRAGKHVFCEKPLTRTVHESRALRELARKHGVATSMGNQGTYSGPFRRALELIGAGKIGRVRAVHVWNSGGGADRTQPPAGSRPVPDWLAWDLWLGPARQRPFHPDWLNRKPWRDFGTGQLGNWAPHTANLGFMALKVHQLWLGDRGGKPAPRIAVEAVSSGVNRLSFPRWEHVRWSVPARDGLEPIAIDWYNGPAPGATDILDRALPDATEQQKKPYRWAGTVIEGTDGTVLTTGHNMSFVLLPAEKFRGVQRDRPETLPRSRGPEQDWFAACRGGKKPWAHFDYASALCEFLLLGNVATQFPGRLEFDPQAMKIVNHPAADAALRCEYRKGWTL